MTLSRGVGSGDTVGRVMERSLDVIMSGLIKPFVQQAIELDLPVLMLFDESPGNAQHKKLAIVLAFFNLPLMKRALIFDVEFLNRASNAYAVLRLMRSALTRDILCSEGSMRTPYWRGVAGPVSARSVSRCRRRAWPRSSRRDWTLIRRRRPGRKSWSACASPSFQ